MISRAMLYGVSDIEAIQNIDHQCFAEHAYRNHSIRQMLDLFSDLVFIAERDGEPLGYVLGGINSQQEAWLLSIAVVPKERRSGAGKILLYDLLQELRQRKIESVLLTVDPDNKKARTFFEGWGWRKEADIYDYFDEQDKRILMRLPL